MAAAAARAALVAMQKKQRKQDDLMKSLIERNKLNENRREYLHDILFDKDDTKFIAQIASGMKVAEGDVPTEKKPTTRDDDEFIQPFHLSEKHYHYLKRHIQSDRAVVTRWMDAYFISLPMCFSLKIRPDESRLTYEKLLRVQRINEHILYAQELVNNKYFNGVIVFSIVAAGVLVGIQSYPEMDSKGLEVADIIIQVIFTFECMVKITAEGKHPLRYWTGSERKWNNFDFWLVFVCWIPIGGNVAFLRLLRLMRLLKLVAKVKQLQVIVMGLAKGLSAVSYIILLMLLIFYLFAVMGVASFRDNDPFHFGSLGVAMLSLFRAATLEDWSDIMYINWFGCDSDFSGVAGVYSMAVEDEIKTQSGNFLALNCEKPRAQPLLSAFFFITFALIAAFVTMALFVGAVCGGMYEALDDFKAIEEEERVRREKEEAAKEEGSLFGKKAFKRAFDTVDTDCSGLIELDELRNAMKLLGVVVSEEAAQEILDDVDVDGNGGLDFDEFVSVMTGGGDGCDEKDVVVGPRRVDSMRRTMSMNSEPDSAEEEVVQARCMYLANHIRRAWKGDVNKKFDIKETDPIWRRWYFSAAMKADVVCADSRFINLVTMTILAAGVVVGVQTETNSSSSLLDALDGMILAVFTMEVVLKVMAEGDEPWRYLNDNWNCFDFFIVGACFIFMLPFMPDVGSMLAMLRLLRLLRVLKLVKALPQLRIITVALISGFGSISFVTIMLFLLFYLFANIAIIFFGENDPMHFGNLQLALSSLFVIATLDDWTDIMYINMLGCNEYGYEFGTPSLGFDSKSHDKPFQNCTKPNALGWLAAAFIVVFVVLGSFVMLNLFIGIVSTAMEQAKSDMASEADVLQRLQERAGQLNLSKREVKLFELVFCELDTRKQNKLDNSDLKMLVRCLPMLHFATALLEEKHDDTPKNSFKVMNKSDIENYMQFIDKKYYGVIELPEFLVLMDFMRRADKTPSLLYAFRESFDLAIREEDADLAERHTLKTQYLEKEKEDANVLFQKVSKMPLEEVRCELVENNRKLVEMKVELEKQKSSKELVSFDCKRAKLRIAELEEELALVKRTPSSPNMLSAMKKMSSNWTSRSDISDTDITNSNDLSEVLPPICGSENRHS